MTKSIFTAVSTKDLSWEERFNDKETESADGAASLRICCSNKLAW